MGAALPVEAVGLHKRFGQRTAVEDLSLRVEEGKVYGFLGPNGAGKTTTIRMLLGLITPSQGSVRIFGRDIRKDFKRAVSQVGAMVEGPAFYPFLSARKNLRLFGRLSGGIAEGRIDEVLAQVGLSARAEQKVAGFSHGMKQRLGIGLALLEEPRLLVLDEPTNGLDPQGTRQIREMVRAIRDDGRTTVFLSSHLLGEMERICDRVAILSRGRMLREGSLDELLGSDAGVIQLEVDLERDAVALDLLAARFGATPRLVRRGHLELEAEGIGPAEVNRALHSEGIAVHGLGARRRTLEQVFVALTGDASDIQ
ncbi:MAG: ABC transporter ATP-binding protein [Deltaproteobacteria bacterium]|jgi:ABC-2 type transport system ATP-binding protein|nr:ABC transporter ATP-binding protein [Deltaproteobacteria bacterium]